jgi:hypothetical protein
VSARTVIAPLIPDDETDWTRANAWTDQLRTQFTNGRDANLRCACHVDLTEYARPGEHCPCGRWVDPFAPMHETEIRGRYGHARILPESYTHETRTRIGPRHERLAMVWLADRLCRPRCSCDCHAHNGAGPGEKAALFPQGSS